MEHHLLQPELQVMLIPALFLEMVAPRQQILEMGGWVNVLHVCYCKI